MIDDNPSIHVDFRKILCPDRSGEGAVQELESILFNTAPRPDAGPVFELQSAYQGQEALEMVRRSLAQDQPYALAFVDVRMPPGWDGIETTARLWEVDPALQIVICTAYSDYSWDEMRARLGQPENLVVLKKPFDNVEVQQLAHAMGRKRDLNLQAATATDRLHGVVRDMQEMLVRSAGARGLTRAQAAGVSNLKPPNPGADGIDVRSLPDVLHRLRHTLESTFNQLRDTEVQLVHSEKMASLGRMSAGIMHEINNPLNYALTAINLCRRHATDISESSREEFLETLTDIREGLSHIASVVRDLREFNHPSYGAMATVEVKRVADVAVRLLAGELKGQVEVENLIPEEFTVDAVGPRLTQVFINLLHNAADALRSKTFPPGERPRIRLSADGNGECRMVRVRDNGPGMSAVSLGRIFEPFFTTKETGRGMGLGLSICYRLLRDVGATIEARSEEGQYCEFVIAFPVPPGIPEGSHLAGEMAAST